MLPARPTHLMARPSTRHLLTRRGCLDRQSVFVAVDSSRYRQKRSCSDDGEYCEYTLPIDWWWAGDAAIADGFAATFDDFECFSRLLLHMVLFGHAAPCDAKPRLKLSPPNRRLAQWRVDGSAALTVSCTCQPRPVRTSHARHFFWGLYFFHTLRLRERCEVGHVGLAGVHFTLERFRTGGVPPASGGRGVEWLQPHWHALSLPGHSTCGKQAPSSGYALQCPLRRGHEPQLRFTAPGWRKPPITARRNVSGSAFRGHCGTTEPGEGDCTQGYRGSWAIPLSAGATLETAEALCRHRCARCGRCRFLSVSLSFRDCSWFSSCELGSLHQSPSGFQTFAA